MALSEADKKFLTDAQQKAIIEATTAWNIAKRNNDQAGMDAAAKRAAAVRAQAGYSGGKDGTGYTALGNGGKPKVVNDLSPLAVERADERDKSNAASATRQAAQTAPNTPVAKGSFTGNRETTYTPKFSAGKLVAGTVEKGLNEFSQGIGATGAALEKVLLSPLDLVTGEKFGTAASEIGLFSKARENDRQTGERLQQKYASNVEAGGKAAQLVDKYGTMTVAAIPDALLAVATGGGSAAPTVGKAAQSAAYKIAESYAKNPQFWASFARVFGTGYEQAKADGASEAQAYANALGNGMFNAAIEVGGGIQTLPRELQNESVWRAVGKTMVEEAGEEVTQGIAERGAQNIFYNKGNPLFSATDPNAVLNPNTAKEEAIGGAVVGGLLGGGQAGTVNLINAIVNAQNTAPQTHNTDTAQIPSQIPRSAENGGNLTGKEKMPTAAVNEATEGIIVPPAQNAEVQATVERGRSDRPLGNNATQEGVATDGIVAQNEHMSSDRLLEILLGNRGRATEQEQAAFVGKYGEDAYVGAITDGVNSGAAAIDAGGNVYRVNDAEHIDSRTSATVGKRSLPAFQYQHPEMQPYYKEVAAVLLDEMGDAEKGGRIVRIPEGRDANGVWQEESYIRTKRGASDAVVKLLDDQNLSYADAEKALNAIIEDKGQENFAAAKRAEIVIDELIESDYHSKWGDISTLIDRDGYLAAKGKIAGAAMRSDVDALADVDALPAEKRDGLGGADASENPPGTVGAAQAGFTTPNAQGTEQTSKLSESIPYSKAQAEATGLTSDEYARIFRYQSQTEERSMILADDLLYVYDGETGRRTFLRDYDEASFHELVKSLDEAPAWNAPMMDAARMIQQELQGRSANMEIDSDEYIDFLRILREHETATGQGVQANAKWSRSDNEAGAGSETDAWENLQNSNLTEQERAARFQRIVQWDARIEQVSEGDTASLKQIIMEVAQERGVLNTALANRRSGVISRIAGNALDSLTFPQLKQFAYASTSALSVDANEANIGQKLKTLQVLNMLSNPRTASKNILSNTAFYGLDAAAMRGGAILDMALSQITGTRSVAFEQSALSKTATGAAVKAMKMSIAEIALDVDMNAEQNRYGRSGSRTFKASGNLAERVLSSVERNEAFLLTATDEFYKGAARSTAKSTQKLMDAGKIKAGKDYATQQADALARYRTFQDDSRLSVAIQTIHDTLNLIGIGDSGKTMRGKTVHAFGVGDLVAPFTRVAGNLVTRGVEFSPIGAVNGTVEIAGVIADAARGNVDVAKQAKAVSDTARGLTGTAIAFGFMALAQAGLLRDADDEDNENVAAFNATEGVSGTQLNIDAAKRFVSGGNAAWQSGDTLLDLSSIEPLNMLVDLGAKLAKNDGSGILSVFKTTGASVAESAAELPVMSTVGNAATDIIRYHEPAGEVVARELGSTAVSSVIPNILAAAAKGMDDRPRNTYTGDTLVNIIRDNAKNKVPGLRETLPASTSVTGEPKTYQGDATKRLVDAIVNPFGTSTFEQSDVSKEMERVRNATGDASFYPTKAIPSELKANGKTVQLDYAQRQDFQRERGKTTIEAMRAMMATGAYRSASDTEKAELLNLCGDYAYYAAKAGVLGDDSVDAKWISARNAQEEAGIVRGAVDFLLERKKQSDAAAKAKEEKAAAWEKTLASLKPYGVTQEVLDDADLNGGGVNQAEMAAYLKTRGDLDAAEKQMIWMSVGGWKTSYADYTKKHK